MDYSSFSFVKTCYTDFEYSGGLVSSQVEYCYNSVTALNEIIFLCAVFLGIVFVGIQLVNLRKR